MKKLLVTSILSILLVSFIPTIAKSDTVSDIKKFACTWQQIAAWFTKVEDGRIVATQAQLDQMNASVNQAWAATILVANGLQQSTQMRIQSYGRRLVKL